MEIFPSLTYVKYNSALLTGLPCIELILTDSPEGTQFNHVASHNAQGKGDWKLIAK